MLKKTGLQTIIEVNPVNHLHNSSSHIDKHNVRFATLHLLVQVMKDKCYIYLDYLHVHSHLVTQMCSFFAL